MGLTNSQSTRPPPSHNRQVSKPELPQSPMPNPPASNQRGKQSRRPRLTSMHSAATHQCYSQPPSHKHTMGTIPMNCAEKLPEPNNFLQSTHQVTIDFRFLKSMAEERPKPNLEPRHQTTVSSIKFRKGPTKPMTLTATPETPLS